MDLRTTYMGIDLKNPLIAGASSLTASVETLKKIEDAGAGAVVLKSLFEEQLQLERFEFDENRDKFENGVSPEIDSFFPHVLEFSGLDGHLLWVQEVKKSLSIPVIASINAQSTETWVEYAQKLQETGVDGLELNVYSVPEDTNTSSESIENDQIAAISKVVNSVSIPVSVKMTSYYSNILNMADRLSSSGVKAIILFNRLFQPKIDPMSEKIDSRPYLSSPEECRLPIRFIGMLHGKVSANLCASTGISEGADIAASILAGATAVQTVSSLYRNGIPQISKMLKDLNEWFDRQEVKSIKDIRGRLSKEQIKDPWAYRRAQYINIFWRANQIIEGANLP